MLNTPPYAALLAFGVCRRGLRIIEGAIVDRLKVEQNGL